MHFRQPSHGLPLPLDVLGQDEAVPNVIDPDHGDLVEKMLDLIRIRIFGLFTILILALFP